MLNLKTYLKSIIIPVIIGGIVGLIISNSLDYNSLEKPLFSPPSILFPIVWTILYILMGISYAILKDNKLITNKANFIYYLQLFVNAIWPILFFTLKLRLLAFLWIIFLLVLIIIMIIKFYQLNKLSGILQIPYLVWTLFASYLNLFTYLLNK